MKSLDLSPALPAVPLQSGAVSRANLLRDVMALPDRGAPTGTDVAPRRDFGRDLRDAQTPAKPAPDHVSPKAAPQAHQDRAAPNHDAAPAPTAVAVQARHVASKAKDVPASDTATADQKGTDAPADTAVPQPVQTTAAKPAHKAPDGDADAPDAAPDAAPDQTATPVVPDAGQIALTPATPTPVVAPPVADALAVTLRPLGGAKGAPASTETSDPAAGPDAGGDDAETLFGTATDAGTAELPGPQTHTGPRGAKPAGVALPNAVPAVDAPRPDAAPVLAATAAPGHGAQTTPAAPTPATDQTSGAAGPAVPQGLTLLQTAQPQPTAGANAAPGAAINTTLPAWESALANTVAGHAAKSVGGMELTLSPEHLGGLQIRIDMADGAARVTIVTQTAEAQSLFQTAQHRLAEAFDHAGLTLASQQSATQDSAAQGNNPRPGGGQGTYQTAAQAGDGQTGAGQAGAGQSGSAARGRLSPPNGSFGSHDGGPSHATGPAQQGLLNILA